MIMERNLLNFCADLDWTPISTDHQDKSIKNNSFKKNLLQEIIQCRQLGHPDISIQLAEKGLTLFKNDPLFFDNLARAYKKINKHEQAIKNWLNVFGDFKASETIRISALNNLLYYHNFRQQFFYDNSVVSSTLNPKLKILIECSIDFREKKEPRIALYLLEKAWINGFKHPSIVDNFARTQSLLGNWYQSFEVWNLLTTTSINKNIEKSAQMSLDKEEKEYFMTLYKNILKLAAKFNQKNIKEFSDLSSFLQFIQTRNALEPLPTPKDDFLKFNVSLFKFLQHKNIDVSATYELYFKACLKLGYFAEAEAFYYQHSNLLIDFEDYMEDQLDLQKSKFFASKIGLINQDLVRLLDEETLDISQISLKDIYSYSELQQFCENLLEELLQQSLPHTVIDIFNVFHQHHFLTPLMFNFHGLACLELNMREKAISSLQEFIIFTQRPLEILDLDQFQTRYGELIFSNELKKAIYQQLDSGNYYSASTILVNAILISRQLAILDRPNLISLVYNHKKFLEDVKCPVKRELIDEYANIEFYSQFLNNCKAICDDKKFILEML